jgi:hypothetical protein
MSPHDHFDELVSGYSDDRLTSAELAELEQLLSDDPALRQRYLELTALHGSLAWVCVAREERTADQVRIQQSLAARPSHRRRLVGVFGALTTVAAALLLAFHMLSRPDPNSIAGTSRTPAARMVELVGAGEVLNSAGQLVALASGQEIVPGQTVRMSEENSYGIIEYSDGTRLHLSAATTVHLSTWQQAGGKDPGVKVFLSGGVLRAEVAKPASGGAMMLATPHAEVRGPGTTFTCSVGTEATRLEMETGRAHLIRQADGKAIELEPGLYAVSTTEATEELSPRPMMSRQLRSEVKIARQHIRLAGPALALSTDGLKLATASQGQIMFWNTQTGQKELTITARNEETRCLSFAPDGKVLAGGGPEPALVVWDLDRRQERHRVPSPFGLRSLAYSPDARWLAGTSEAGGKSATIQVWYALTGLEHRRFPVGGGSAHSLAVAPDGSLLAAGTGERGVVLWNIVTGKELACLKTSPRKERAEMVAFSPDGRWLAAAIWGKGLIRFWEVPGLTEKTSFPTPGRQVRALVFSPDGRHVAAGTQDGSLILWQRDTGAELLCQRVDNRTVRLLSFCADSRTLLVIGESGVVQQWELKPGGTEEE